MRARITVGLVFLVASTGCRSGFELDEIDASSVDIDASIDTGASACDLASDLPPSSDLAFHFTFDAAVSGGLVSGELGAVATCVDSTCPTTRAGRVGALAFHFDRNSSQYLRIDGTNVDFSDGFSISLWVRPESVSAIEQALVSKTRAAPTIDSNSFFLGIEQDRIRFNSHSGTGSLDTLDLLGAVADWQHVAATFDGGVKRVFIDGELGAIDSIADMPFNDRDILIGADEDDLEVGDYFGGDLDDFRFYNRDLTDEEVEALAACGSPSS